MKRYTVRWEQTLRYEIEVDAESENDARTAVINRRSDRPRVTFESDFRALSVSATRGGIGGPTLFDIEPPPGQVGHDHPETSHAAARSAPNRLKFNSQRFRILEVLAAHGPATAAQVADRLGMSRNQTATRLGECRDAGWVDYARNSSGKVITAPTSSDGEGMVQEVTNDGWAAMRAARGITPAPRHA